MTRWVNESGVAGPEHDEVCAAIDLDDEGSCSCDAHEGAGKVGESEILTDLVTRLRAMAAQEFDERGPHDARGAAIWDVAAWIDEDYAPVRAIRADMQAVVDGLRESARDLRREAGK